MSTIMQTVTIQPNRQISLNFAVPDDFPLGEADISIQIHPSRLHHQHLGQVHLDEDAECTPSHVERHEQMMSFVGALADCQAFMGDAAETQRELRGEWDNRSKQVEDILGKKSVR